VRAVHPVLRPDRRRPVHRDARAWRAATGRHLRQRAVRVVLLRQCRADLTGAAYRFRARPFDLVSSPSVCEHCASGCAQRTDHRRGKVLRRLAGDEPEVNEEWNCDKGRWAFSYATQPDVITTPLIRDADGTLQPASWSHAVTVATEGLEAARGRTGVLVGGRVTWEDAYAYSKFARI